MIHVEADSGSQALELLKAAAIQGDAYDLALLDLMMPEMDGYELARLIKSDPLTKGMHLVLLTSAGARGEIRSCPGRNRSFSYQASPPVTVVRLFDERHYSNATSGLPQSCNCKTCRHSHLASGGEDLLQAHSAGRR